MTTYHTGNLRSSNEALIPVRNFGAMTRADIEAGFGAVGNIFYIEKLASAAAAGGNAAYLRWLMDDWGYNITISVPFTAQQTEAWAAFDWYFEPGFQFNGPQYAGGKLPGFYGGDGVNASGGNNATIGFSSRLMWRTNGRAAVYMYYPDKPGTYGEDGDFVQNWGVNNSDYYYPVGQWFRVFVRKVMNTNGSTYNGSIEIWVDELSGAGPVKRYQKTNMRWRTSTSYTVDRFVLVTFFGGDSAGWYPGTPQYARSKKLEVATSQLWTATSGTAQTRSIETIAAGITREPTLTRGTAQTRSIETIAAGTTREPTLIQSGNQIRSIETIVAGTTREPTLLQSGAQAIGLETIAAQGTREPTLVREGGPQAIGVGSIGGGVTREPRLFIFGTAHWRMKLATSSVWTDLWVTRFEPKDRTEIVQFGLQGRNYDGVVMGQHLGLQAKMEVLVSSAAQDDEVMAVLRAGTNIQVESSLGQAWRMRVVSHVDREQNLTASAEGPYPVKHEYFLGFTMVEAL